MLTLSVIIVIYHLVLVYKALDIKLPIFFFLLKLAVKKCKYELDIHLWATIQMRNQLKKLVIRFVYIQFWFC